MIVRFREDVDGVSEGNLHMRRLHCMLRVQDFFECYQGLFAQHAAAQALWRRTAYIHAQQ
jgi:hypothetical protein